MRLRTNDHFIRRGRKPKPYTALLIQLKRRGNIQISNVNFFAPFTAGPVVRFREHGLAHDRVAAHFFFVPIAEDERSEEHTSELQSHSDLVCRLLLEKKK